jgi:hypothetical protein
VALPAPAGSQEALRPVEPPPAPPSGRRELLTSLNEVRVRIQACAGLSAPAAADEDTPRAREASARANAGRPRTALMLEMERLENEVRVRSAEVQSRGPGADDLIRCANQFLVGQTIEAASSRAGGEPLKMQFVLDKGMQ